MSDKKERLDVLLVKRGFFTSREQARANIMAGKIYIDGQKADKCGENVKENSEIDFRGEKLQYVSRGGLKLEKALARFNISMEQKTCFDIGASTGGFTDCMLQNGARKVFAIDVGYGQFAWKLRTDERVVCMERTNVRYVTPEGIGETGDFASIDVSFISLKKVILPVAKLLNENGEMVVLIKPQFEAGREKVGKKGVVRDPEVHYEVVKSIIDFVISENFSVLALDFSPIKGPEGNIEYLLHFTKKSDISTNLNEEYIRDVVNMSKQTLNVVVE